MSVHQKGKDVSKSSLFRALVLGMGLYFSFAGYPQPTNNNDSLKIPWIRQDLNFLQFFDREAIGNFALKLKNTQTTQVSILLLGDSHIQSGIFPGEFRRQLQLQYGLGGFGTIFPYSIARTYSSKEYRTSARGKWEYGSTLRNDAGLPLGISGYCGRTSDTAAGFTISFKSDLPHHYRKLKVFCLKDSKCFDFIIKSGGDSTKVIMDSILMYPSPCVEILLPAAGNSISLELVKSREGQEQFEFYGLSLESETGNGLVVSESGVGGVTFRSVLNMPLYDQQVKVINPDLVILDFGTNDIYANGMDAGEETLVRAVIQKVRASSPGAFILLTSVQDMYRRKKNLASPPLFSAMMKSIAREEKCAFYDWYQVSGGKKSMRLWKQQGLVMKDNVHLSAEGYRLKGKLLSEAISNTIDWYREHPGQDSLSLPVPDTLMEMESSSQLSDTTPDNPSADLKQGKASAGKMILYKIKKGDTLSGIAERYRVSARKIMQWNHLKNTKIKAGQKLKIYTGSSH